MITLPPPDPPLTPNPIAQAAHKYLGPDYTGDNQPNMESMTKQAIFLAIPNARTGEQNDWSTIEERLEMYGKEPGTPLTAEKEQLCREAIEEAKEFYERANEPVKEEEPDPYGDR